MTLSYDISGDGPTVVLLHSSVCDRRMWDPQLAPLHKAGYGVVRCDFRGFGETPVADGPFSDAEDVCALLDHLRLEQFALIGSSHGGEVALEVAALRPAAVTAVALLCAGMPGHVPGPALSTYARRKKALLAAGDIPGAVELSQTTWLGPHADDSVRDRVRDMQRHAFEVQRAAEYTSAPAGVDLARITAPCLAVSGAYDMADFRDIAGSLPGRVDRARHLELPWAGHFPGLERPDEVSEMLTGFLAETWPGRS
ncbi:alpha/beta fold hydrolase [Streptomyces sp. NPDC088847]|uniref:alpha/beta fold hydrolase n=1 Tax=Streptomyces sp. NPDC088847 TaxID=3365909 RepID=UPI0037FE3992